MSTVIGPRRVRVFPNLNLVRGGNSELNSLNFKTYLVIRGKNLIACWCSCKEYLNSSYVNSISQSAS